MKKLLLLFLVFLVSLPVCKAVFAAEAVIEPVDAKLTINGVEASEFESGYATVEATFKNNGTSDETVTVVISEYTENNGIVTMNDTSCVAKTIPAGKPVTITPGLKISSDTSKVKFFAYVSKNLGPVAVKSFKIKGFELVGVEDEIITVYKIGNLSKNPVIDKTEISGLEAPAVCKWADNKKAAIAVTIDDGVYESAVIYNELQKKHGIYSTQFMITRKLYNENDGTVNTDLVADWQDIFDDGYMDLGNHSYSHKIKYNESNTYIQSQLEDDISGSYNKLCTLFPGQDVIAFAAPWMQSPDNAYKEMMKHHYAVRDKFENAKRILVDRSTADALNSKVDEVIQSEGFAYELYHTIASDGEYTITKDNADKHFKYLSEKSAEGKVWSGSYTQVVKYIYERDSAKSEILWATNSSMGISLTDNMDDTIFDYPLTLKINLPSTWSGSVNVKQDGNTESFKIFTESGKNYAYINVIPDSGNAIVSPQ